MLLYWRQYPRAKYFLNFFLSLSLNPANIFHPYPLFGSWPVWNSGLQTSLRVSFVALVLQASQVELISWTWCPRTFYFFLWAFSAWAKCYGSIKSRIILLCSGESSFLSASAWESLKTKIASNLLWSQLTLACPRCGKESPLNEICNYMNFLPGMRTSWNKGESWIFRLLVLKEPF